MGERTALEEQRIDETAELTEFHGRRRAQLDAWTILQSKLEATLDCDRNRNGDDSRRFRV
jgi:hypothetical protein